MTRDGAGHGTDPLSYLGPLDAFGLYRALFGWGIADAKLRGIVRAEDLRDWFWREGDDSPRRENPTEPGRPHGWVPFLNIDNGDHRRDVNIPNPFALEHLVRFLAEHWAPIKRSFALHQAAEDYCVSVKHVTGLDTPPSALASGFANLSREGLARPPLGDRYRAHVDVAGYSANVDGELVGALLGREADAIGLADPAAFAAELAGLCRAPVDGAARGFPIGPVAYRFLQELIGTAVDQRIWDDGFRYTRLADDFICGVHDEATGLRFMERVAEELAPFGLSLNEPKSRLLPSSDGDRPWVAELGRFPLSHPATRDETAELLRLVIGHLRDGKGGPNHLQTMVMRLMQAGLDPDAAHLLGETLMRFAMLNGTWEGRRAAFLVMLTIGDLHPETLDRRLFTDYARFLLRISVGTDVELFTHAVSYGLHYGLDLVDVLADELAPAILSEGGCLDRAIVHRYLAEFGGGHRGPGAGLLAALEAEAATHLADEADFDRHWILAYEVLDADRFRPPGPDATAWREMKERGFRFIC